MSKGQAIQAILFGKDKPAIKAVFDFDVSTNTDAEIVLKFNLWVRYFTPLQFPDKDAPFHEEIDLNNLKVYRGDLDAFVDVVFRGGAKTTRTKMFFAFVILCDTSRFRRFLKILTKDNNNSKQIVTDIYNILINRRVALLYPDVFLKTKEKREETMKSFTTSWGVKLMAGTVGTEQRGQIQGEEESSRPDFVWFDDFETRKTLRSPVETKSIWDNMEEARTGLSKGGGSIYTCNYISERGNVHKLISTSRVNKSDKLLIVPIVEHGEPTWAIYTDEDIEYMRKTDDDFAGERMCEPSAGSDVLFDRETLKAMATREPIKVLAGFKKFYEYNPGHRYGVGADVAGGVGLDSSTSVIIDFSTIPCRVVGTYESNTIKPDVFGDELERQATMFGEPIIAPENNKFDMCIGRLKQIYKKIYFTQPKEDKIEPNKVKPKTYGWNTNAATKPKMLFDLKKAVEDGLLDLTDEMIVLEGCSYSRDDLMDSEVDPRLTTRHFDLLIACAIAWQMKDYAQEVKKKQRGPRTKVNKYEIYD